MKSLQRVLSTVKKITIHVNFFCLQRSINLAVSVVVIGLEVTHMRLESATSDGNSTQEWQKYIKTPNNFVSCWGFNFLYSVMMKGWSLKASIYLHIPFQVVNSRHVVDLNYHVASVDYVLHGLLDLWCFRNRASVCLFTQVTISLAHNSQISLTSSRDVSWLSDSRMSVVQSQFSLLV